MDLDSKTEQPEETEVSIEQKYRFVFGTPMGIAVFADIMRMCHFWGKLDPNNPAQVAEYNIGQQILAQCVVSIDKDYEISSLQALLRLRVMQ